MKDMLKYLMLWRQKRNELPVEADPAADWLQMRVLLDVHLPQTPKGGSFKGFRTLPAIFITFTAAAMIYTASSIYHLEKKARTARHFEKSWRVKSSDAVIKAKPLAQKDPENGDSLFAAAKNASTTPNADSAAKTTNTPLSTSPATDNARNPNNPPNRFKASGKRSVGKADHQSANSSANSSQLSAGAGAHSVSGRRSSPGFGRPANSNPGHAVNNGHANGQTTQVNNTDAGDNMRAGLFNNNGPKNMSGNEVPLLFSPNTPNPIALSLKTIQPLTLPAFRIGGQNQTVTTTKSKKKATQNTGPSKIDWGLLMGVNTSGSFTPKTQNSNFYGSLPVDPYFGLFGTYNFNDTWSVSAQVQLFNPQNIVTTYTHANRSKVDSGQMLTITASRKMYSVTVPIYAVYKTGNGFSLKLGPVISFPVKQINANTVLQPSSIRNDSVYYSNITKLLSATKFEQSVNFGISAGASIQFNRFILGASYIKSLSGYQVSSALGNFKSYNGAFQITIGFQLDKPKTKP